MARLPESDEGIDRHGDEEDREVRDREREGLHALDIIRDFIGFSFRILSFRNRGSLGGACTSASQFY